MQKRLLALVATVAMVLSMFAGVVFAEGDISILVGGEAIVADYVELNDVDDVSISFEGLSGGELVYLNSVEQTLDVDAFDATLIYSKPYTVTVVKSVMPYDAVSFEFTVVKSATPVVLTAVGTTEVTLPDDGEVYVRFNTNMNLGDLTANGPDAATITATFAAGQYSFPVAHDAAPGKYEVELPEGYLGEGVSFTVKSQLVPDAPASVARVGNAEIEAGSYFRIKVTGPAAEASDFAVPVGFEVIEAGAEFLVLVPATASGEYTLTLKVDGFEEATLTFVVGEEEEEPEVPEDIEGKIKLDKTEFVLGEKIELTGKILGDDNKVIKKHFELAISPELYGYYKQLEGGGTELVEIPFDEDFAFNGVIGLELKPVRIREGRVTYDAPILPGEYTLTATLEGYDIEEVKFVIKDNVETDKDLGFTWGDYKATDRFAYHNRLPYGVDAVNVVLKLNGSIIDYARVAGRSFYFDIPYSRFTEAGDLVVEYEALSGRNIVLIKGEIEPATVKFSVAPSAIIHSSPTNVKFEMTTAKLYAEAEEWVFRIVDAKDDKAVPLFTETVDGAVKSIVMPITPKSTDRSKTWVAEVIGYINNEVCYEGEADFRVVHPDRYNLIGLPKTIELTKNGTDIGAGVLSVTYYDKDYVQNNGYRTATITEIVAKGAGIDTKWTKDTDVKPAGAKLLPTHGGVIEITVKAEGKDGQIFTFNEKVTVKAGQITVEPNSVARNKAQDVVVKLVDVEGKEVNNAYIFVTTTERAKFDFEDETPKINPEKINIRGGVYTIKMTAAELKNAGTRYIYAIVNDKDGQTWMAVSKLTVLGDKIYDVSLSVEDVLAGQDTAAVITVADKDGKYIKPDKVTIQYGKTTPKTITLGAASGNGYKVTLPALNYGGEVTIKAYTDSDNFYGESTFKAYKPVLVVDVEKVTDQVYSDFSFKLVDPRSEEEVVLDWDVFIEATYAKYHSVEKWDYAGKTKSELPFEQDNLVQLLGSKDGHKMRFLLKADYLVAEEAAEIPTLVFTAKDDADVELDTVVEIGKATLTPDPANPVAGRDSAVTFTLSDANGNPLEGYKIYRAHFMDAELGKTDENGQYVYQARMDGVESFAAELDLLLKDEVTGKKQYGLVTAQTVPGYDTEKPAVTYTVNGDKATLVITDNVQVTRVAIDGKDLSIWAGKEVTHNVTLRPGLNKFAVKAQDSAGNVLDTVVEITYEVESVVLKGDQVKRKGDFTFVQLRQFQELGADIGWNATTKTATVILSDTKIEVVIGSTTAMINGKAVTMPAAPFIEGDRTYIPVRFVSENLDWKVGWAAGDVITITLP